MIGVSSEYRQQLIAGNRNWVIKVPVFLAGNVSGTPDFTLTNEHIWDNGIVLDEAISSDNTFDIGAAIVGSLKVVIDNITGAFSHYDFFNAKLTLWLGVEGDVDGGGEQRYYRMGFFVVDTPSYNGSLITLNCLDNMTWFDAPFDEVTGITYPANAGDVVQAICSHVAVTLGTPSFPNYQSTSTRIAVKPEQKLSCREVLQYIAQMCCCYCKINTAGQLVLKWHDKSEIIGQIGYDGGTYLTTTTPYSDGDDVQGGRWYWDGDTYVWEDLGSFDGGTFQDLNESAYISQNYDIEVSTDDVVITGCRVRNNSSKENSFDVLWVDPSVEADHERYVLVIDSNPFILTETQAVEIANIVGSTLAGLPIRGFSATSLADFSYETGDMAIVIDFRGNRYYTWLTHFTFTTNNSERFSCGVESVRKRSEQRFSTVAETLEKAKTAISAYDAAVKAMNELAQNSIGYNEYVVNDGTGNVMYRYNGADTPTGTNPQFPNSTVVFKISGDGVFVALAANGDIDPDGTCHYSNGYDANSGTAILNLIYAQGLNADWITAGTISANRVRSGTLSLGGSVNGQYHNASLYMYDSSDNETGHWNRDGISVKTGTITLGGKTGRDDGRNGVYIGSTGLALGSNFKVTDSGELTATSGNFSGNLNAATGTISDGQGILAVVGGSLHMSASNPGLFAECNGGNPMESCWGAVNSSATNSSGTPLQTTTWNVIQAGVNASDKRLKTKIKNISADFAKALIMGVNPVSFYYKKNKKLPPELQLGVIAQDILKINKEYGLTEKNRLCYEEDNGMLAVQYKQLIAPMIKVIQSQQEEIDLLKQEVAELKARIK